MTSIRTWFSRVTEFIAAMTLAAIFVTFLIQIFTRYAAKIAWLMPIPPVSNWMQNLEPLGWTVNLISLLWVWAVFFGGAFIVKSKDHVTFDILYLSAPKPMRRIFAVLSAIGVIAVLLYALPPTWDSIFANRLMELKKIQTLRMPITGDKIAIKWVFAPFILFLVVTVIRSAWHATRTILFGLSENTADTETGEPS